MPRLVRQLCLCFFRCAVRSERAGAPARAQATIPHCERNMAMCRNSLVEKNSGLFSEGYGNSSGVTGKWRPCASPIMPCANRTRKFVRDQEAEMAVPFVHDDVICVAFAGRAASS